MGAKFFSKRTKMNIKNYLTILSPYQDRLINGIKAAVAILIGIIIIRAIDVEQSQWILISITVVMATQISVGGALQKAKARFIGTCAGVT
ncbi:MAG: FUSC family protein, partial [Proteobacteria bacterium]|nr:FUSC family protein [Pseudomonadota bacterium]